MPTRNEQLIPLDTPVPRGWKDFGELETADGMRRFIVFWRHEKRITNKELKRLKQEQPISRAAAEKNWR
jgi:hypothetical protein